MFKSLNVFSMLGWCSVFIGLSIVLGAFGSHALTKMLSAQKLEVFNKANFYLCTQSIGILVLLVVNNTTKIQISPMSVYALVIGMLVFCLALYLVSFSEMEGFGLLRKFGIVAPFGALLMIYGWVLTAFSFFKGASSI